MMLCCAECSGLSHLFLLKQVEKCQLFNTKRIIKSEFHPKSGIDFKLKFSKKKKVSFQEQVNYFRYYFYIFLHIEDTSQKAMSPFICVKPHLSNPAYFALLEGVKRFKMAAALINVVDFGESLDKPQRPTLPIKYEAGQF